MANGLQRIILRGAECIFVGGTMLPQEAGSPPTARGARIVFFVSIVALGILSLLMIEAWGWIRVCRVPARFLPPRLAVPDRYGLVLRSSGPRPRRDSWPYGSFRPAEDTSVTGCACLRSRRS